ncbi:neuroendocrine convertase 1-like [Planococcus citri]|uniref:neuroendocrine convertase 1-like n=1 Tax=Planococcus citri TaxID=170843 RepID=UPI0031F7F643
MWNVFVITFSCLLSTCYGIRERHIEYYVNQWTAKVIGHLETAQVIAKTEGLEVREIPEIPELLLFEHPRHPKAAAYENKMLTERLESYTEIVWIRQISAHRRETRSITCPRTGITSSTSRYSEVTVDKSFREQWYMQDCRVDSSQGPTYDINVIPVWYEEKLLGFGINVLIVDDGMETQHPDLSLNYNPRYGLDLVDGSNSPEPKHIDRIYNHGTKCAGVVGMVIDNGECGVGVAPMVTLGAVRLLGYKPSNDLLDARALSFRSDEVHVSSNSWGPTDDGRTMAPIGPLTKAALKDGAEKGLKGKGVVYIFAGGNGKVRGDNCGCDPFVSSMHTIAVASCNQLGRRSKYSERCAAILVTAYSGDKINAFNVVSSDAFGQCTNQHSGTSAAAPLVAGGAALAREANHNLKKRDIEYLIVLTSEVAPLDSNTGWQRNDAGFWVSHDFGFGLVNIREMVKLAKTFQNVPGLVSCVEEPHLSHALSITYEEPLRIEIVGSGCENAVNEVNYLEHVQLDITLSYSVRGDLQIKLISPSGVVAHVLEPRPEDRSPDGIREWTFDSIQTWGEPAKGKWTVEIVDVSGRLSNKGKLEHIALVFHGTREMPDIYRTRRTYYRFRVPNQTHLKTD